MPTIFLSYAHDDNLVPDGLKGRGWVSFFDDSLGIELRERGLLDVKVWRDKRDFDPMNLVTDTLDAGVASSDILLAVVSPLYVQKPYCTFELEGFVHAKNTGGQNSYRERLLLVLKRPVRDDQYPASIRGMGYIPFFEMNREKAQDEPFFKGFGTTVSQQYWDSIRDVASRLEKSLAESADRAREAEKARQQAAAAPGITIYLAEPSSDLHDLHWSLRKELEVQGCRIVPADPWPDNPADAAKHLRAALASAQLSVHLLGATQGSDSASGLTGLSGLQLELAAQRADQDGNFRRLIWLSDRLESPDAAQLDLIKNLQNGVGLRAQDEFVKSGAEGFKEVLRDELKRRAGTKTKPPRIYLICDQADETDALNLRPRLAAAGFDVELPEFAADGTVPVDEHQRCLRSCDTILVFWGRNTEARIRAKLADVDAAVASMRQGSGFLMRGLYLAPPVSPRKSTFTSPLVEVTLGDPGELSRLRPGTSEQAARTAA
jgi:hypothetical protein